MEQLPFSRRDFLKLSAAGMLGALMAEAGVGRVLAKPRTQGRMTLSGIGLYSEPAFKARKLHAYGRDDVVSITGEVAGEAGNPFNAKWYQLNGEGYTYSGWVQPVESVFQVPDYDIPVAGRLGEITVPYSITRLQPSVWAKNGYRIYYATTHWVTGVIANKHEKSVWYEIYDDHLHKTFYVDSADMRLVPYDELTALSPEVPNESKHILVDTAAQLVTAFVGEKAVLAARCSSGGKGTKTPLGEFLTYHKGPTIHMTNDGAAGAGQGYDLPGVPWVTFFTGTGVSFHGTYWHNDYGTPRSHGCVNLLPEDAKFLYRWTNPLVPVDTRYLHLPGTGTRVEIVSSNA
ncbi:MAG TPA: L,D-transpeptidase family protein [Anaerolineales bacterium]